ncbi:MAG: EAL domain-containing protein [Burkholderiales bacterium]|nr:EAL domain-containing protein [Burkholderiales bacterium]
MATILIVDDRAINRQFLHTLLSYGGHSVIEAADGVEALEAAAGQRIDLVISDILMPRMDGVELAKRMQAGRAQADLPIIFYTATYRVNDARDLAATCGVVRVLAKPTEPQLLMDTVAEVLRQPSQTNHRVDSAYPPVSALLQQPLGMDTVGGLQAQLRVALGLGVEQAGESSASGTLSTALNQIQDISLRLSALLEVGLELSCEHEPQALLTLCCRAAQDILGAHFVAIGIVEDGSLGRYAARGLPDEASNALRFIDPGRGVIGAAMSTRKLCRVDERDGSVVELGLPIEHPPMRHMLVVPLHTPRQVFGWMYVANKFNGTRFDESDEQLLQTLAVQLTQAYENLVMLVEIRQHADALLAEANTRRAAQAALTESELRFRQIAENLREVLFLIDPLETRNFYVSPAYETIWQQPCEVLRERPQAWMDLIHEDDREIVAQSNAHRAATGMIDVEYRIVRPDGDIRWIAARGFPIFDAGGKLSRIAGVAEDISERKQHERRITCLSRIQSVLSGINSAIVRIRDRNALLTEVCRVAVEHGGFRLAWIGTVDPANGRMTPRASAGISDSLFAHLQSLAHSVTPESPVLFNRALRSGEAALCTRLEETEEILIRDQAVGLGCKSVVALPIRPGEPDAGVLMLFSPESEFFDEDERRLLSEVAGDIGYGLEYIAKEDRLNYLAYFDPLTGLPNSDLFLDRLSQMIQGLEPEGGHIALILLDLDHFTGINDSYGRHVGDAVLKHVGNCLDRTLPEPHTVSRIGSDTFAAALHCRQIAEEAGVLARDIQPALARTIAFGGHEIAMSARAGIAIYPGDGTCATDLFKNAEAALKRARASNAEYLYYRPEINASVADLMQLELELRAAIAEEQLIAYYQPKLDLVTGRIVAAEALVRWQHPVHGVVSPATFIPMAEESGLIVQIGEWMLRAICRQQAQWRDAHMPVIPVAVNLSALQCQRGNIRDVIKHLLDGFQLDPRLLTLELTESAVIHDPVEAAALLSSLRDLGLQLAVDDFGTGFSSLSYLKRFPFSVVKIDRSFIADVISSTEDAAIVRAIIAMAHQLNMKVVAEGVETLAQLNFLRDKGCDEMQGYFFSPPVPAAEFETLLRTGRGLDIPSTEPSLRRTLLLVDDEQAILASLERMLRPDGYYILTALSGQEALEKLALNTVQVIVSDQRMPGMSGTQFLEIVKELHPDTVRIILSGYTDLQVVTDSVNRGAVFKFLTKPWNDDLLRDQIRDAFRRYRPTADHHER